MKIITEQDDVHLIINEMNYSIIYSNLEKILISHLTLIYDNTSFLSINKFSSLVQKIFILKKKNEIFSSKRLITLFSGCNLEEVDHAISVLVNANDSYSPATRWSDKIRGKNILIEILENERLKYENCDKCAFSLNCLSLDFVEKKYVSTDNVTPKSFFVFKNWRLYDDLR